MTQDNTPKVAGENASDRIMHLLDDSFTREPKPTRKQVAMVLHTLAGHTAICAMMDYDRIERFPGSENFGKELELWPTETSIGRWFHAVAHNLEDS
jgi:hypothetical protein